jgi:hypothetical protein
MVSVVAMITLLESGGHTIDIAFGIMLMEVTGMVEDASTVWTATLGPLLTHVILVHIEANG